MHDFRHHTKTVEGVHWHWVECGEGDPVVLLHGIPESWQCWRHQMPKLATQFRVLAFDLKGELAGRDIVAVYRCHCRF